MNAKQSSRQRIISFLRPSMAEVIIAISLITLLMLASLISVYLESYPLVQDVQLMFQNTMEKIGVALDTQLVTNGVTIFFWAIVGLTMYCLLWALIVVFADLRNDIVVSEHFLHPRSLHKSDYWVAALSRRIFIGTAYILIGIYIVLLLRSLPIVYDTIRSLFHGQNNYALPAFSSILAIATWLLGWHLILFVYRITISFSKESVEL